MDGALSLNLYPPGSSQPRHEHDFGSITLILAGSLSECVENRTEMAGPLSISIKPPGIPHADRIGPTGARMLQLRIHPTEYDGLVRSGVPVERWQWLHGGPPARALLALARTHRAGSTLTADVHDALAALTDAVPLTGRPPRWLTLVREAIDDDPGGAPRVRELAAKAGVHPVYLARQFRRFFGCSVMAHVRRRRAHAAAALIAGGLGLADVARRSGYSDHAHLSRDFKSLAGICPREWRRLAGSR